MTLHGVRSKATVQAVAVARAEADISPRSKAANVGPKLGGPTLKQTTFYWSTIDKYTRPPEL